MFPTSTFVDVADIDTEKVGWDVPTDPIEATCVSVTEGEETKLLTLVVALAELTNETKSTRVVPTDVFAAIPDDENCVSNTTFPSTPDVEIDDIDTSDAVDIVPASTDDETFVAG